jgi:hypothetical protein
LKRNYFFLEEEKSARKDHPFKLLWVFLGDSLENKKKKGFSLFNLSAFNGSKLSLFSFVSTLHVGLYFFYYGLVRFCVRVRDIRLGGIFKREDLHNYSTWYLTTASSPPLFMRFLVLIVFLSRYTTCFQSYIWGCWELFYFYLLFFYEQRSVD